MTHRHEVRELVGGMITELHTFVSESKGINQNKQSDQYPGVGRGVVKIEDEVTSYNMSKTRYQPFTSDLVREMLWVLESD